MSNTEIEFAQQLHAEDIVLPVLVEAHPSTSKRRRPTQVPEPLSEGSSDDDNFDNILEDDGKLIILMKLHPTIHLLMHKFHEKTDISTDVCPIIAINFFQRNTLRFNFSYQK